MENKQKRMQELVWKLHIASKEYYQGDAEVMSNREYDELYDELVILEKELGITLSMSPTVNVGYEVLSELPKEQHERAMLSLDKTKDIEQFKAFLGPKKGLLSWKLDGLTVVLTYKNGTLSKAVTRGNGEVGEVITSNAKMFKNIPLHIAFKEELILRGEAVIGYKDFKDINENIEESEAKYKNPRNLCSGSVRQLNNEITAKRNVRFFAFSLVKAEGIQDANSRNTQLEWLKNQGFEVVESQFVTMETIKEAVDQFAKKIEYFDLPSDGLVLIYDDIIYGESLGTTAKFPRDSYAFKWADEQKETTLLEVEWSPSRTGLINPVAIFEPVELEGTTVSRASVHNISIVEELELGIGDVIEVYKANMIIPQIAKNLTRSGSLVIPKECPVCHGDTQIKQISDAKTLCCPNEECPVKKLKSFALLTSRNSLNIEGLSEATLEKLITKGLIKEYADMFYLAKHEETIIKMEGFKEKSYQNLQESLEKARNTTLPKVIYGLGIANIGLANAKMICNSFESNINRILAASEEELLEVDGIGPVIASAFIKYFAKENHVIEFHRLLGELHIEEEKNMEELIFSKMNFVITGSMVHFANREALKEIIEKRGGKVTGSVTSKTNYLINNDIESLTSKNKKARELNVPIISEEDFLKMI